MNRIILASLLFGLAQIGWADMDISPKPRIINGNIASNTQIPWQVALVTNPLDAYQSYICSGSLIADRWVVTAAHCIQELKQKNKDAYVLVGTHSLQDTQHGQIIKAKQDYIHEQYNDQTYDNDIALIELVEPVNFSQCGKSCQTIDAMYPEIEKLYAPISSFVQIAGWGVIEDCENSDSLICQQYSGQMIRNPELYPTTLRYTTLKLSHCLSASSLYNNEQITENMLCAESPIQENATDTCFGDSGAGLTVQNGLEKPYLLGVASWGVGCAKQGYAGVYTRVANYNNWINNHIYPTEPSEQNNTVHRTSGGGVGIFMLLVLLGLGFIRWQLIKKS